MKKKDYIIIAIILLVGLGLFFGLKSYLDKNYEKKESNGSSEVEKEKIKIDDATINKLFDSLITSDGYQSLYFNEKVTSTDSNADFIMFNIGQYLIDVNSD